MTAHRHEAQLSRERAALGAAILDVTGKQAGMLVAMLREDDFASSLNRSCFVAMRRLIGRNVIPLDYNCVVSELQDLGIFEQYENGIAYVAGLGDGIVTAQPMLRRLTELREVVRRRKLAERIERAAGD